MKLVLIVGDSAVGKMTVGQELMKITDLRLFHNHMIIEPTLEVFGNFNREVIKKARQVFFEEFLKTDHYGLIFTYMWAFDLQEDWDYIQSVIKQFENKNSDIYIVELIASQQTRLDRNGTSNRLKHKKSKNDIELSNIRLINENLNYRLVSNEGEIPYKNYLRINNENLEAKDVALKIKNGFNL